MSHEEQPLAPLKELLRDPLDLVLERRDTFRHVFCALSPRRRGGFALPTTPEGGPEASARLARVQATLQVNGTPQLLPDAPGFPSHLSIMRTTVLYSAADNWLLTFSVRAVFNHLERVYHAERGGRELHSADFAHAFLFLLIDHGLLPAHIVDHLQRHDLSELAQWLDRDFAGALWLWRRVYRIFYANPRIFIGKRSGAGEAHIWEKWLEFLKIPKEHQHRQGELSSVTVSSIGPIFSTAEYIAAVRQQHRWDQFLETIPQVQAPTPASPSSSSSSASSSHSPTSPPGRTRRPSSPPTPFPSHLRARGKSITHPVPASQQHHDAPGTFMSPRDVPASPGPRRYREEGIEYPVRPLRPPEPPRMVYVTNLEQEREKERDPFKPGQRTKEERERKKRSFGQMFVPRRLRDKIRSRTA
ncbi:hypothetical protein JCM6882_003241 [Rhodosporidiobolus microsporus]